MVEFSIQISRNVSFNTHQLKLILIWIKVSYIMFLLLEENSTGFVLAWLNLNWWSTIICQGKGLGDGCHFSKTMVNITHIPPTVDQYMADYWLQRDGWGVNQVSTDILTKCWLIVSTDGLPINLNDMLTDTWLTLGQHIDWVSADISTDTWSTCWLIVLTDTRLTDDSSAHDLLYLCMDFFILL